MGQVTVDPYVRKGKRALTCFTGARLNILESCAVSQNAEFGVAVLTIKLLRLAIGKVLQKKINNFFFQRSSKFVF